MGSTTTNTSLPWMETPLIPSPHLSRAAGCNIYLKLENLQPSGSFKSRGIGNLMLQEIASRPDGQNLHFYSSSGGNAGLACATQAPGAIHGIACSVGGGGLLNGLFQGIEKHEAVRASSNPPWPEARRPSVLAVETRGADSLNASVEAAEHVTLPGITSIAKCLGAVRVSSKTWEWAQRKARLGPSEVTNATADGPAELESVAVEDSEAALACVQFADDTRFVVEVACGATIAACYSGLLRQRLGRGLTDKEWRHKNIVVIVCGGSDVSLEVLEGYKRDYGSAA
ncbi:hypothetical protein VdG1_07804 [Verticillium dahliae VDG1]|nr:hypothetical protein VdG1_07804 [Verticillium dahliae VDG1]